MASWIHADPWTLAVRWIHVGLWTLAARWIHADPWTHVARLILVVPLIRGIRPVTCMGCPAAMPSGLSAE